MKPVYVDITNFTELTGITKNAAETAARLIQEGIDVRLVSYSAKHHAYRLIDNNRFILNFNGLHNDKNEYFTDTLITPDEFDENSVFFEINNAWEHLPNRSWLLSRLKNRRVRIVTLIHSLEIIRKPQNIDKNELVRFMEFLTAHLRYADEFLVTDEAVKADMELLFGQLEMAKKPVTLTSAEKFGELLTGGKKQKKFSHKPVKQVVFLSARPAPILATLPYIEEFMPFLTELVVCCPDKMADFMKANYKGRLRLTTVTDGELLAGCELPPDHSTRNFFLRCLAMELDVIDDEFIMCDDDYRPLRPLTEEVFYKDGRYIGYHFSDISTWKYRINSLFSYDFCHFRTLGFLRSHGYPTFQYSSHQPQIINKIWYREMLRKYPDIRTKGYDEWSTYFNYISAEHPEQFQPSSHVTLSWPRTGGEPLGDVQPDYLFENFYIEDYGRKQVFHGFSTEFTTAEKVLADNAKKIAISRDYEKIYSESAEHDSAYETKHLSKYRRMPHISVHYGSSPSALNIGVPEFVELSCSKKNTFKVSISREQVSEANMALTVIVLTLVGKSGRVYCESALDAVQQLEYGHIILEITENIPDGEQLTLRARTWLSTKRVEKFAEIPVTLVK